MNSQKTLIILACLCFLAGPAAAADENICQHYYNLQEENRMQVAAPTVVDIDETTGNLLVRGPMPLIIRDGTSNTAGCRPQAQWQFAYDNLNGMLSAGKDYVPAYFTDSKKTALAGQMQNFDLKDYALIDISLLEMKGSDLSFFLSERKASSTSSRCAGKLYPGTIKDLPGNVVGSGFGYCDPNDAKCLEDRLFSDDDGSCSYVNLTLELDTLMKEKDPSGKKRLVYYHCTQGIDKTGAVTISYLMKKSPGMTMDQALDYSQNLGDTEPDPNRVPAQTGWKIPPFMVTLAQQFCYQELADNTSRCAINEPPRVYLPGSQAHSHLPGQDATVTPVPTPVPTPAPAPVALPTQTPVPDRKYNPAAGRDVDF